MSIRGRWDPKHLPSASPLTLRYYASLENLPDEARSGVTPDSYETAVIGALARWQTTGVVRFVAANSADESDFTISWQNEQHGSCSRLLRWEGKRAHAGPVERGTFIHLNREISWRARPVIDDATRPKPEADPLLATLLHEIGHILGLHHSTEASGVMNGAFDQHHTSLTELDRAALHSLYGGGTPDTSDVTVGYFDAGGRFARHGVPVQRAALSPSEVAWIDLDGDGVRELAVWPQKWRPGGGVMLYRFDAAGRLLESIGPVSGLLSPSMPLRLVPRKEKGAVALYVYPQSGRRSEYARYHALYFNEQLLSYPFLDGTPLELADGRKDLDGNRRFDNARTPTPQLPLAAPELTPTKPTDRRFPTTVVHVIDLNRDGGVDALVRTRDPRRSTAETERWIYAWALTQKTPEGYEWRWGPRFRADEVTVASRADKKIAAAVVGFAAE